MGDIRPEWVEKGAHVLLHGHPLLNKTESDRLARAVLAAVLPDVWPCDNYQAPLTCLTAPSSESARCDFCRAQAEAVGESYEFITERRVELAREDARKAHEVINDLKDRLAQYRLHAVASDAPVRRAVAEAAWNEGWDAGWMAEDGEQHNPYSAEGGQ